MESIARSRNQSNLLSRQSYRSYTLAGLDRVNSEQCPRDIRPGVSNAAAHPEVCHSLPVQPLSLSFPGMRLARHPFLLVGAQFIGAEAETIQSASVPLSGWAINGVSRAFRCHSINTSNDAVSRPATELHSDVP